MMYRGENHMDIKQIILGAVAIIIGVILLPTIAYFVATAKTNASVAEVSGISAVLDLILYGFAFGLVGIGIGMIWMSFRD